MLYPFELRGPQFRVPSHVQSQFYSQTSKTVCRFPTLRSRDGAVAKKIRGKLHYFGMWDDREAAFKKYLDELIGRLKEDAVRSI